MFSICPLEKWFGRLVVICISVFLLIVSGVSAQQSNEEKQARINEIVFVPPASGAPADRVGAATRDVEREDSLLTLLAPPGGGITTLTRPPLVWYLGETFAGQMQSQIAPVAAPQSGVMKTSNSRFRKGFYALDLSRSDFVLQTGTIYEWKVVLMDAQSGSIKDQKTTYVEMVEKPVVSMPEDISTLAAEGLWFDALAPYVEIGLSGKVRISQREGFTSLALSAGLPLQ